MQTLPCQEAAPRLEKLLGEDHEEALRQIREFQAAMTHLQYEGKLALGKNLSRAREVVRFFDGEVRGHMDREEKILFPYLETHLPKLTPLIVLLRSEHRTFQNTLERFRARLEELAKEKSERRRSPILSDLKEAGTYLVYLLQGHHQEESQILYKVADDLLQKEEKQELARRFADGKGGD